MSGLYLRTCWSLKSIAVTVLELLAFNAQKFGGYVTLATPPFRKILRGLSLETCSSNVKSIALTVLNWSDCVYTWWLRFPPLHCVLTQDRCCNSSYFPFWPLTWGASYARLHYSVSVLSVSSRFALVYTFLTRILLMSTGKCFIRVILTFLLFSCSVKFRIIYLLCLNMHYPLCRHRPLFYSSH